MRWHLNRRLASLVAATVQEIQVQYLVGKTPWRSPPQRSCLKNPVDRGAGGLQSMGSQRVRLKVSHRHFHFSLPLLGYVRTCPRRLSRGKNKLG